MYLGSNAIFFRWITDPRTKRTADNEHWAEYTTLCSLCDIEYNFIGKFETLPEDISFVLRKLYHKEEDYWFPTVNNARSAANLTEKCYSQIDSKLIHTVRESFKSDFRLMNYTINDYLSISINNMNTSIHHF